MTQHELIQLLAREIIVNKSDTDPAIRELFKSHSLDFIKKLDNLH